MVSLDESSFEIRVHLPHGITNKIKVLKRRGYGHRNNHRYRNKVLAITQHQPG